MSRIERVARAILKHAPPTGGPLGSVLAEMQLTLELLERTRDLYGRMDRELEEMELEVGTQILRRAAYDERLAQRVHELRRHRRRVEIERDEHERKTALELLRLVNTHAALQGH